MENKQWLLLSGLFFEVLKVLHKLLKSLSFLTVPLLSYCCHLSTKNLKNKGLLGILNYGIFQLMRLLNSLESGSRSNNEVHVV